MWKKAFLISALGAALLVQTPTHANRVQLFLDCLVERLLQIRNQDHTLFAYMNRSGTPEYCWELYQQLYAINPTQPLQPMDENLQNIENNSFQHTSLSRDLRGLKAANLDDLNSKITILIQQYAHNLIRDDIDRLVDEIEMALNIDLRENYLCYDLEDWPSIRGNITNYLYQIMAFSSMKTIRTYFARYLQHIAEKTRQNQCNQSLSGEDCVDDCYRVLRDLPLIYTYLTTQ